MAHLMALRNELLRHQLLLMKLIRSQAKIGTTFLKRAEKILLRATETGKYDRLRVDLIALVGELPRDALKALYELATYETRFTARVVKKYLPQAIKVPTDVQVIRKVDTKKVSVSLRTMPQTIEQSYQLFAGAKVNQYLQAVRDSQTMGESPELQQARIKNLTSGLFSVQNLALAGVAVVATANMSRALVATENKLQLEWSAMLDEATCDYCDEMDGSIHESDFDNEIPAHSNCRCTWIIL